MVHMREELKQMVLPIIMRGNTNTGGSLQPGEMEIVGMRNSRGGDNPLQQTKNGDQGDEMTAGKNTNT